MGVIGGMVLAIGLVTVGGVLGWTVASIILTIRAIEDQESLWGDYWQDEDK
jgi:hypothetical protein